MSQFVSTPQMRVVAACVKSNTPVILWGQPGVGKTAKIEAYGRAWGRHVETVVGSIRDATDFLGLPLEVDGEVRYSPPAWAKRLNAAPSGLLFLDELTTAESVQKAMLRILQERWVGEYPLSDQVAIVAAANPPEIAVDGAELPGAVANRLIHLEWHFDVEEWLLGVGDDFATAKFAPLNALTGRGDDVARTDAYSSVVGFLRARPELLAPGQPDDPEAAGRAWPSPRSWTNLISVLAHIDPRDEEAAFLAAKGAVGEGVGIEFFNWRSESNLPSPERVLSDPSVIDFTATPDVLFAIARGVTHLTVSRGDAATYNAAIAVMSAYAEANRSDIALPSVKELLSTKPKDVKAWTSEVRDKFTALFESTGLLEVAA